MIPIAQPLIGEEEEKAVLEVLRSGQLAQGPRVRAFEEAFAAYCGVKHAIATSSGTTALHIALLAHGIGPGDEVITTPFTFIATANAVLYVGARPVFVDIEPETFNLNPALVEEAITPRTRAILPVHLFGHPAEMPALLEIAERHGLVVIEDAAQAHGAAIEGRKVGTFATGCFSFYPTKNMTTGEGGIITTDDDRIAEQARLLRAHGMRRRYYNEQLGYNFRMTDIHAAIGLAQLKKLERWNERRIANAAYLTRRLQGLPGIVPPPVRPGHRHVFHQYTIRVLEDRDGLVERLRARGVGTGIYYPRTLPAQPVYRDLGYDGRFPVAEEAARQVLSLPVHPALTPTDLEIIVEAVREGVLAR